MSPRRIVSITLAVAVAVSASTIPATAAITQTDMLVAGRAIDFIENLKHGDVRVGIIYDPSNAQSAQQAAELKVLMGNGLRIGNLTLRPVLLSGGTFEGSGADLYFMAEGLGAVAAKVGRASRDRKIPCITFDLSQVRNGTCAIGVQARPKIEIIVNHAAAEASGTILAAVFRMMITEI